MHLAACVRWVDLRPEIDPLTGDVTTDVRRAGFSAADRAALEVALRLAGEWGGSVAVASVAPVGAEGALRELAASGGEVVERVVRVETEDVAGGLAAAVRDADVVICGDVSVDGGSGATPALVAHHLGVAQALGLVEVTAADRGVVEATRRLGGGRSERLRVTAPAVLSVEGSVAVLRRASLPAIAAAPSRVVDVVHHDGRAPSLHVVATGPWRPRARVVAPPGGSPRERIVSLTGALVERTPPRVVEVPPAEAADVILAQLRDWGYES